MKAILSLYRRFVQSQFGHVTASLFFGCLDVVHYIIYSILGLNAPPNYDAKWQKDRLKNYPEVPYPLPQTGAPKPKFSIWDTRGFYTTALLFHYIDQEQVKKFLPKGLELDPEVVDAEGRYPVAYMFGYQQDLQRIWNKFPGVNYLEFGVAVLALRCPGTAGYQGPFMYMPRLYLNRFYPTWLGWLCGYAKQLARISVGPDHYTVKSFFKGKPILEAKFEPHGTIGGWREFPKFEPWRSLLSVPAANHFVDDGFLFLYYDWPWRYALMQPVDATVTVTTDDIPGLPRGTYQFDGIDSSSAGGLRLSIPWELVAPFATTELPHPIVDDTYLENLEPVAAGTGATD